MLARPGLPEFEYKIAGSPEEVFAVLQEQGSDIKLLLGGTDLFIQMRDHGRSPGMLLDLKGLPGMQEVKFDQETGLQVGAGVTLNQLSANQDIQAIFPILAQAADTVGNYQLRNRATVGGNICNASPSADMAPALLIYEAALVVNSPRGERTISVIDFWTGPGKTALESDEYLQAIHFPLPPSEAVGQYLKLGRSKMGDLAVVGVAVLGFPDQGLPAGMRFRIGINSTAPTPYRVPAVEEFLAEHEITEELLQQAAQEAMAISAPIEDVRASARYQKKMVRNLTMKGLMAAWKDLK